MDVYNATESNSVNNLLVGLNDLMPWTFQSEGSVGESFCQVYGSTFTVIKLLATHVIGLPNVPDGERFITAKKVMLIGTSLFALESLGDLFCYGNTFYEKGHLVSRNAIVNIARTGLKAFELIPNINVLNVKIVLNHALQLLLTYGDLVERKEIHYSSKNEKLMSADINLYNQFYKAVSDGKVDTVRLLVKQYKSQFPNTSISFNQVAGNMDGLFLVLGTGKAPKIEIVKIFMETGCNPRAVFNGKTPLDLISTYVEENPNDLAGQHVKVYMTGMKKVIEDYMDGSNTRSIEGPSMQNPTLTSSRRDVIDVEDGTCDGDECE